MKSSVKSSFLLALVILAVPDLYSQKQGGCSGGVYQLVKPFLGKWKEYTVTDSTETFIGDLVSAMELDGCAISQRFTGSDGSFSYVSFGFVKPSSNIWEETYVFNNGSHSVYHWIADGADILMRRVGGTRLLDYMQQLRLTDIGPDKYDVVEEHSKDGGKTWSAVELTRIKRIE